MRENDGRKLDHHTLEQMRLRAVNAVESGVHPEDVAASLGMADDTMRCGLQENPNWITSTAIFPERYGWVGIPYMIKAINGEEVPENLFVPLVAVTGETIGDYYELSC